MKEKVLNFYGYKIEIDDDLHIYNDVFSEFEREGWSAYKDIRLKMQEANNIEELLQTESDIVERQTNYFLEKSLKFLRKYNINISQDDFCDEFSEDYFPLADVQGDFRNKALSILAMNPNQKIYREQQRKSRQLPTWESFGFGISGAIKGAASAAALNIGTELLASVGDSIVDKIDKFRADLFEEAFCDIEFIDEFAHDIAKCFVSMGLAVCSKLYKKKIISKSRFVNTDITVELATAKNPDMPQYEKVETLLSCLNKNPYKFDIYEQLFNICGERDQSVINLTEYFGLKVQLEYYYQRIFIEKFEPIVELPENSLAECENKYKSLIQLFKTYGIINNDLSYNSQNGTMFDFTKKDYDFILNEIERLRQLAFVEDGITFKHAYEKANYIGEKEREQKRLNAIKEEQEVKKEFIFSIIKVIITVAVIALVILGGIKLISSAYHTITGSGYSKIETKIKTIQLKPKYPEETEFFENTKIPNYHRWFGGKLILQDDGQLDNYIPYVRYIYTYNDEESPKQYEELLIDLGFKIKRSDSPNAEEQITVKTYAKNDSGKSIRVQVNTYHERHAVSMMCYSQ